MSEPELRWLELGAFIRAERRRADLSLRRLSELSGISNPYLSQIERGVRRPSAEILRQVAHALAIPAESLYVQAGILDPPEALGSLREHIRRDAHLTAEQKQTLLRVYESFRRENEQAPPSRPARTLAHRGCGRGESPTSAGS
ncbi:MAG: helix-turn-helix domain-containing protein [Acidimicrobiales bacterium]